jgi:hypothetical protein
MYFAWNKADHLATPIGIKDWLIRHRNQTPMCVLCHAEMTVRGEHAQGSTHFMHLRHSGCPTIKAAHAPYEHFTRLPSTPGAAIQARTFLRENLLGVFSRMRKLVPAITWSELEQMCLQAKKLRIWDLVGFTEAYVPSVLLTCMPTFAATEYRKKEVFFVLEPNPSRESSYWNFPSSRKRNLFEVEIKSGALAIHEIDFRLAKGQTIDNILKHLS